MFVPFSNILFPGSKQFPFPEQSKSLDLVELVEVIVILQPLINLKELRLTTVHQTSDSIQTQGSVVIMIYLGMDYHSRSF